MRYNPKIVLAFWAANGIAGALAEYQFDLERKWRFDFAFPARRLAIEVQGAIFGTGRPCPLCKQRKAGGHNRGAAMVKEHEKRNAALLAGWGILYCQPKEILTVEFARLVKKAL